MPLRGREREAITSADNYTGWGGCSWKERGRDIQGETVKARCFKRNKDSGLNYRSLRKR